MKRFQAIVIYLSLCVAVVATPAFAREVQEPVAVGQKCVVHIKSNSPGSAMTVRGEMVRSNERTIVLKNATRTVTKESGVPLLGQIPLLGHLFKNVSVGQEVVPGMLSIDRDTVSKIEKATPHEE